MVRGMETWTLDRLMPFALWRIDILEVPIIKRSYSFVISSTFCNGKSIQIFLKQCTPFLPSPENCSIPLAHFTYIHYNFSLMELATSLVTAEFLSL